MSETRESTEDRDRSEQCEIRIKGHLDGKWADWFEGMTITQADNGETVLRGLVVDQAALYGLLRRVRDLGLPLLSVGQIKQPDGADVDANTDHNRSQHETNT
jgi:hypothetical protein